METYRVLLAIALLAIPAVGVLVPLTSLVILRRRSRTASEIESQRKVRPLVVIGALLFWTALSAGTVVLFIHLTFGYTWGWAHSGAPAPANEKIALLAMVVAALLLLSGCGALLHRLLVATRRTVL